MPKMKCNCGQILNLSDIPSKIKYLFISDTDYDQYFGMIDAEKLYCHMQSFIECHSCKRLWVFWNGFNEPPTEYTRK